MADNEITISSNDDQGIEASYDRSDNAIAFTGYYDHYASLGTHTVHLGTFLKELDITIDDCKRALDEIELVQCRFDCDADCDVCGKLGVVGLCNNCADAIPNISHTEDGADWVMSEDVGL